MIFRRLVVDLVALSRETVDRRTLRIRLPDSDPSEDFFIRLLCPRVKAEGAFRVRRPLTAGSWVPDALLPRPIVVVRPEPLAIAPGGDETSSALKRSRLRRSNGLFFIGLTTTGET